MRIRILVKGTELDCLAAATLRMPRGVTVTPRRMTFGATTADLDVPEGTDVFPRLARWFNESGTCPAGGFPAWTLLHYNSEG